MYAETWPEILPGIPKTLGGCDSPPEQASRADEETTVYHQGNRTDLRGDGERHGWCERSDEGNDRGDVSPTSWPR